MPKKGTNHKSDLQPWQPIPDQTKDQIISWLYQRSDLIRIIKKMTKDNYLSEELNSELFLWLCNKQENELQSLYQKSEIDYVILSWLKLQFHSKTSPFYYKYKKVMTPEQQAKVIESLYTPGDDTKEKYTTALENAINRMISPGEYKNYHQDILRAYLRLGKINLVAKEYRIRPEYISQAIADAKDMLRDMISQDVKIYFDNLLNEYE